MRQPPSRDAILQNALLAALPTAVRKRIASRGRIVELSFKQILLEEGEPIRHVYFPLTGVVSLVMLLSNGNIVEVATIGPEGFVGMPAFFGARHVPGRALSQVPGQGLRLSTSDFRDIVEHSKPMRDLLHRYAQALINQISWSVACLRQHAIERRAARWLLMTHDRVEGDTFPLTQEFLSQMLSTRRQEVSAAASSLQKRGMIRYVRGKITVLDRKRLEREACECYANVRMEYRRLVGRSGAR